MQFIDECVFQTREVGCLFYEFNEYVICDVDLNMKNKDQCQCKWIKWHRIYSTGFINPKSNFRNGELIQQVLM